MATFNLEGYIETAWGGGELTGIDQFVAEDCVFRDVSGSIRLTGIDALTANLRQWHEVFDDPHVEIRRVLEDRSSPTIVWDWTLTARPAIARNSADNRAEVSIYGITFATILDGKIAEEMNCTDMKEFVDLVKGCRE